MKPAQFLKILSNLRRADDALGEALTEIALYVLEQWHKHGNKTPHMQLFLAVDGGVDEHGLFAGKGETVRGLSKGVSTLFAGLRRLPKRDETADVEMAALDAVHAGMKTRAEASEEAKAKRDTRAKAKARAEAEAEEAKETEAAAFKLMLIDAAGAGTAITPEEYAALMQTLQLLRDQDAIDAEIRVVEIIEPAPALIG